LRSTTLWCALGVSGVLIVAEGACRKPVAVDPADALYHRAIELFAKASADTHDLTYRDPRFDEVLTALGEVPPGSELRGKADALAEQIRQARAEAERADLDSKKALSDALASPEFSPRPRDAALPVGMGKGGTRSADGRDLPIRPGFGYTGRSSPASAVPTAGESRLPAWYKQAGYMGLGKRVIGLAATGSTGGAAAVTGPPPAPPAADATAATAPAAAPPSLAPAEAAPPPAGPPPIFGLPGPAGRAVMGGR
jgi:hypothetical protein